CAACTFTFGPAAVDGPSTPSVAASEPPSPVPTGPGSAAAAMRALCLPPANGSTKPVEPGSTPDAIAAVEQQVEAVRGCSYDHPVAVNPITQAQMDAKVSK